ncbi:uncharacterized protein [Polyergus mexicanus]|uniref:uncharacterized protein n=1 Tax=Polyergus mexicanus TaxID=615972 RepID=UPI0038B68B68
MNLKVVSVDVISLVRECETKSVSPISASSENCPRKRKRRKSPGARNPAEILLILRLLWCVSSVDVTSEEHPRRRKRCKRNPGNPVDLASTVEQINTGFHHSQFRYCASINCNGAVNGANKLSRRLI